MEKESNAFDVKAIIEKQISSLAKTIEEKSNGLSMEEYIALHRQLESYVATCYRHEILPLNENEINKYSLDLNVKTIIEKRICALSKKIEEKSNSLSILDTMALHGLLESYITTYKYYRINEGSIIHKEKATEATVTHPIEDNKDFISASTTTIKGISDIPEGDLDNLNPEGLIAARPTTTISPEDLKNKILEHLPDNFNKKEGTVINKLISAIANGLSS